MSAVSVAAELAYAGAGGRSNRAERGVDVVDIAEDKELEPRRFRLEFACWLEGKELG